MSHVTTMLLLNLIFVQNPLKAK